MLAASLLASFRLGFADDLATLAARQRPARAASPRRAGAALRALRRAASRRGQRRVPSASSSSSRSRPARRAAASPLAAGRTGAAALVVVRGRRASPAAPCSAARCARSIGRRAGPISAPRRSSLHASPVAALAGSYARARRDGVAPAVAWLLGDLSGATVASGLAVLALVGALLAASLGSIGAGARARLGSLGLLAFGVGAGAAGPLVFVGTLVPRTVRALAPGRLGAGTARGERGGGRCDGGGDRRGASPPRRRLRLPLRRAGGAARGADLPRLEPRAPAPRGGPRGPRASRRLELALIVAHDPRGSRARRSAVARDPRRRPELQPCAAARPPARRCATSASRSSTSLVSTRSGSPTQSRRPAK